MLTLTVTHKELLPFAEWTRDAAGLPVTSALLGISTYVFEDLDDATEYLFYKGVSPTRVETVLARGCEFTASTVGLVPGDVITSFRFIR